ncbi:Rha family transcriptional regulator [Variovorax sp. YR216]|uniref:Rha family transcriptional regulator n=1 Tax=Variovorax sp. YR216 TaxID=1882828 RepID=UPI00210E056F|nr:Rha family transcriptional regulator [Variovorax sp. YR216]
MQTNEPNNLVILARDGEPAASTEVIASGMQQQHASVIKLVRKHMATLETFGLVRFQIRPRSAGQHGGGDVELAELNEQQATVLISLMRNSERVVEFKVRLVSEFYRMRSALQNRDMSLWQQLMRLESRDKNSLEWASFGSRKMHERRRELPEIRRERARLESEIQQPLPGVQMPAGLPAAPSLTVVNKGCASNDARKKRSA